MKLFNTTSGPVVEAANEFRQISESFTWDELFNAPDLHDLLRRGIAEWSVRGAPEAAEILAPISTQEVWAAGVTYLRSKKARMDEAKDAGGGDFYDRVYAADRPELFLKATPHRVSGPGQPVRIRYDSTWNVPEPELAVAVNSRGEIIGYTIGNDMSSRDIEGQNPLYLPQAKVYDQCCGLGPCILVKDEPLPPSTAIQISIDRDRETVFEGQTSLDSMKRTPDELVGYLFRDNSFPTGCVLLTGTGIVPPDSFTLHPGDRISIRIDSIGMLENVVVRA